MMEFGGLRFSASSVWQSNPAKFIAPRSTRAGQRMGGLKYERAGQRIDSLKCSNK
jgi:hypothetical protein